MYLHGTASAGIETACVTLPRKMRPFNNKGVFFCGLPLPPGSVSGGGAACFFITLTLLPPLLALRGCTTASLQQRMIFSKRNTWYSRSISDLVTTKTSSNRSSPKFSRWWPFQSLIRAWRLLTVCSFSAWRWASLILSAMRFVASWPDFSSS